jgi:hypothetical protein
VIAVAFYGPKRASFYIDDGTGWRRMSPVDEAHASTGFDQATGRHHIGVSVFRRSGDRFVLAFDLSRLNRKLTSAAVLRLASAWRHVEGHPLSSRSRRRAHFSATFAEIPTTLDRLDWWRAELRYVLMDPISYESAVTHLTVNGDEHASQPSSQ